jgi:flagellar biosynthesis protein FlhB
MMKKNILIFGLIAGLIASSMLIAMTVICYNSGKVEGNMLLGYTFMLVAFSFVFVGVKNYRDKFNDGVISLGKAFKIGLLITLIAATLYVVIWLICYYVFIPDFMEKFTALTINDLKAKTTDPVELKEQIEGIEFYKSMYGSPFGVILLTYMEILPVGLVISLITALILKRKGPYNAIA